MPKYDDSNKRGMRAGMEDRRHRVQHLLTGNEFVRHDAVVRQVAEEDDGKLKAPEDLYEAHLLLTDRRLIYFPDEGPVQEFAFSDLSSCTSAKKGMAGPSWRLHLRRESCTASSHSR
jgi:hypothetical protein